MTTSDTELESSLEAYFRKRIRLVGGYTIKLAPTERGVPDRMVVMPGGRVYLVELKTTHGKLSPIQQIWHERLMRDYQCPVTTLYGREEIVDWLRRVVSTIADAQSKTRRSPTRKVS